MIPQDFISEWRKMAPWTQNDQVEQDLIICRALVDGICIRVFTN
jgi:hypothetical protein